MTDIATAAFVVIPITLATLLVWGVAVTSGRRPAILTALVCVGWMRLTNYAALTGRLRDWNATPPPFALLVIAIVVLAVALAASPIGRRLATGIPLWILVLVQGFRLPLELAMHAMYERGVMPVQMSYSGQNFDILTGASAIVVAGLLRLGVGGRLTTAVWNVLGLMLLINIVTVAILSTPRFAWFGPDRLNTWVFDSPYVWLPAVMVLAALAGHLLIFRALRETARRPS